jgi:lipid-binding SYLF domain-containing protein
MTGTTVAAQFSSTPFQERESIMNSFRKMSIAAGLAVLLAVPAFARADATVTEAKDAVTALKKADPSLKKFFEQSAGYAVFPSVGKGGLVVGGAGGSGIVFEHGKAVGTTTLSQVTIGAQVGGQAYYEIIFFETAETLAAFKKGEWTMAAQVSAVMLQSGASADAKYKEGVAVFTLSKGGAMAEASVGGQKFSYKPMS